MRIAIIGAGLAGLASCYHLQKKLSSKASITIFDQNGIGGGASAVAAGLLHPFGGQKAKLGEKGHEGMAATEELLQQVPTSATQCGILRIPESLEQKKLFQKSADENEGAQWVEQENSPAERSGLWIPSGWVVSTKEYLQAIWLICEKNGAKLKKIKVDSIEELHSYEIIIIAAGAGIFHFPECENLPLRGLKGQLLQFKWPSNLPPLSCALTGPGYLAMDIGNQSCTFGATFEREFAHSETDLETAKKILLPKAASLIPELKHAEILDCQAGIRVTSKYRKPMVGQLQEKVFFFTGLGSKGLLYHALYAKKLINQIAACTDISDE